MNNRKRLAVMVVLCAALLAAALLAGSVLRYPHAQFNGSRVRGENVYMLDFTVLNGEQTHTMALEKGDVLRCRWELRRGQADILITGEGGEKLYRGDSVDRAEFDLIAPDTGRCTITVTGKDAGGVIDIENIGRKD